MQRFLPLALLTLLAACNDRDATTAPDVADALDAASAEGVPGFAGGAVYVLSNAADANAVLAFARRADGGLEAPVAFPTGGAGTGAGLGNQGALAVGAGGHTLYAVDAGSDEISVLRILPNGLDPIATIPSGGDLPISIALHGGLLYVLHDGVDPNVTGFRILPDRTLAPIPGSTRHLSNAAPDAAQVGFSPDGRVLVVTEKGTNSLVSWRVGGDGLLSNRVVTPSAGETPFGFSFDRRGVLLVSEAFGGAPEASTVSSYRYTGTGYVAVNPAVPTTETAACWLVVSPNGGFAYVTNTGSASVTGFAIRGATLVRLDDDGVTGSTGATPIDAGISRNGRFLYTLNAGAGTVSAFRIGADGSLTALGETGGLPAGADGLAAE